MRCSRVVDIGGAALQRRESNSIAPVLYLTAAKVCGDTNNAHNLIWLMEETTLWLLAVDAVLKE